MYASSLQSQHVSPSRGRFSSLTSWTTCSVSLRTLFDFLIAGLPLVDGGDGSGEDSSIGGGIRSSAADKSRRFPRVAGDSSDESSGDSLIDSLGIVDDTKRALIVPGRTVLDDCLREPQSQREERNDSPRCPWSTSGASTASTCASQRQDGGGARVRGGGAAAVAGVRRDADAGENARAMERSHSKDGARSSLCYVRV